MCIDWQLTFNGLTGISTFVMAITAITALSSWQKEFKAKKKTEIYEELIYIISKISLFLQNLRNFMNNTSDKKTNEELTSYSTKLKLLAVKLKAIKNENLYKLVDNISKEIEPIKHFSEKNDDGSFHAWFEYFNANYLNNRDSFKDNVDKNLNNILNLCNKELQKFYK